MLVYSKERFYPTMINTLVLEDADGGFWYVHRAVYDQAVVLSAKQTADGIMTLIDSEYNGTAIEMWYNKAPAPLNILAPYLGLVTGELPPEIEVLAGVLHVITSQIDVYNLIKQKKEHRQTVKLSLSVLNEYQMTWDSFEAQCTKPVFKNPTFAGIPYELGMRLPADRTLPPEVNYGDGNRKGEELVEVISVADAATGEVVNLTVEDLKKDPNWKDLGFGTWYNETLDQCLSFEEEDANYEAEFEGLRKAHLETVGSEVEVDNPQSTLRKKLVKLGG